jgi:hypothetical protein
MRVELDEERCIYFYDEGMARYFIDAHLRNMGLGT